jgi:hypothetical protein
VLVRGEVGKAFIAERITMIALRARQGNISHGIEHDMDQEGR